jgi:hypothetical protein
MKLWHVTGGLVALAALVWTGLLLPLGAQDKGEVKFVFRAFHPKAPPFYQKLVTSTVQEMKVEKQGQPALKQVHTQTIVIKWTPKDDKGNSYVVEQKIEYVDMNIAIGSTTFAYNSGLKDQPKNPMTEFFDSLMNLTLTLYIDKSTLKITKLEGRDKFVDKLSESHPQMKNLLKSILGDDAIKQMSEQTWAAIPSMPVKKGQTWVNESDLNLGAIGTYKSKYTYTFDGAEDKLEKISVVPSVAYVAAKDKGGKDEQLPFDIKSDSILKSVAGPDTAGTVYFDAEKGRISKSSLKMKVEGTVVVAIGGTDTRIALSQTQNSDLTTADKLEDLVPTKKR